LELVPPKGEIAHFGVLFSAQLFHAAVGVFHQRNKTGHSISKLVQSSIAGEKHQQWLVCDDLKQ